MDFSVIFQLRTKRFWWMDVIFYFVISLLVATVLCYVIFLIKNNWQRQDIATETANMGKVGTEQQKADEVEVINYRKKINDFSGLLKNHQFASNVFAFMQTQTRPNIWFKQFSLDEKGGGVQLSGEADNLDALSRQIVVLEKNKYVKGIGNLSSSLSASAKIDFNVSLTLDQSIFDYLSDMTPILEASTPVSQPQTQTTPTALGVPTSSPPGVTQLTVQAHEKLITSFHFLLKPEIVGVLDQTNFTVKLEVPFGTDVKNLAPSIDISPGATILPASNAPQNFVNPVIYTVTAQDGTMQKYTVTVNVLPQSNKQSGKYNSGLLLIIISIIAVILIALIILLVFRRMRIRPTANI